MHALLHDIFNQVSSNNRIIVLVHNPVRLFIGRKSLAFVKELPPLHC